MDTLAIWWRDNAVVFVLGSLAWTGAAAVALLLLRAPIFRQRLAETAIAGWLLWLALGFVPWRAAAVAAPSRGNEAFAIATAVPLGDESAFAGSAWTVAIDCVGVAFAGGVLFASGYLLVAALLLRRLMRRAVAAPVAVRSLLVGLPLGFCAEVKIVVSDLAWRPFCCGLLRPRIVLPRALLALPGLAGGAHLRAVLLHEVAHLARGDLRGRLLFAIALPLQFWNPLFWRLRGHACDAAELLADEVAAGHHQERVRYARSLIDLAELLPAAREVRVTALGVFGPEVHFCKRMTMLLHRRVPLTIRCSRLQTALRSASSVALALASAACWTGPRGEAPSNDPAPATAAAPVTAPARPIGNSQEPRTYFAFKDTDVKKVIDTIARIGGANIVVAPDVVGTVSLQCRDVPWRDALDAAVHQVGARVTVLDRGILRISR